jgi:hypothetical protein
VARRGGKRADSYAVWHPGGRDRPRRPPEPDVGRRSGPYVISLCTSPTPITVVPEAMPRFEPLHIYQLQRHEGNRSQFRLCIGIIETNLEADAILDLVYEFYPRARREPAQDDDRAAVKRKVMAAQPPKRGAQTPQLRRPDPQLSAPFHWDIDELLPRPAADTPDRTTARPLAQRRSPTGASAVRKVPPGLRPAAESPMPAAAAAITLRPRVDRAEVLPGTTVTDVSQAQRTTNRTAVEPRAGQALDRIGFADVAAAPAPGVEEVDSDPNAVTDQVESLQFIFGDPQVEGPPAELSNGEPLSVDRPMLPALEADTVTTQAALATPAVQSRRIGAEVCEPTRVETPNDEVPRAALSPLVSREAASGLLPREAPANSRPAGAPAPRPSTDDSGTLKRFVTRIGTLLESLKAIEPTPSAPADPEVKAASALVEVSEPILAAADPPARPALPEPAPGSGAERAARMRPADPPRSDVPHADSGSDSDAPAIDSTRTVRALTPLELADEQGSRRFAIQLMLCERPIDPAEVPNLPIFGEYRLYSVAGLDDGDGTYALRLGFFSSESAAAAVGGYLAQFFDTPCVRRVSMAEQERFEERRVAPRKDAGELGEHAVIELTCPATLPERQASITPVTGNGESNPRGSPSRWSWLLAPLKR